MIQLLLVLKSKLQHHKVKVGSFLLSNLANLARASLRKSLTSILVKVKIFRQEVTSALAGFHVGQFYPG